MGSIPSKAVGGSVYLTIDALSYLDNESAARVQEAEQLAKVKRALGKPPNLHNLPQEFWDDELVELSEILLPFFEKVFIEGAERLWQTLK